MHRVTELQNIMPVGNIPSVLKRGILSHARCQELPHEDISLSHIQDKRDKKRVPGGYLLHEYANLYFHARNPMLFRRRSENICILQVSKGVLDLDGTVITDQNAASDYVRFLHPLHLGELDFDAIYAQDWTKHNDQISLWRHKSQKCAEVLVYDCICIQYILGAYVRSKASEDELRLLGFNLPIEINPDMFFE